MSSDALRCDECGERHGDWQRTNARKFQSGMHRGVRDTLECGHCGGTTTQVRA